MEKKSRGAKKESSEMQGAVWGEEAWKKEGCVQPEGTRHLGVISYWRNFGHKIGGKMPRE